MTEYITDDGSPHARATGSTLSNAARSAFVELITRHGLEDITIHGVRDLGVNPDGPTSHVAHIDYTDRSSHGDGDADPQPTTLVADATPLSEDGTTITTDDPEVARWRVTLVDTFCHN